MNVGHPSGAKLSRHRGRFHSSFHVSTTTARFISSGPAFLSTDLVLEFGFAEGGPGWGQVARHFDPGEDPALSDSVRARPIGHAPNAFFEADRRNRAQELSRSLMG